MRRSSNVVCLIIAAAGGLAYAPEVSAQSHSTSSRKADVLPSDIAEAMIAWSKCRVDRVSALSRTAHTSEVIVDQAFRECISFERAVERTWERHYGSGSAKQLAGMKATWRNQLVKNVKQVKSGDALKSDDPARRFGLCVGNEAALGADGDETAELIADRAFAACSTHFAAWRKAYAAQFGAANADALEKQMVPKLRQLAIEVVQKRRATR